MPLQKKLAPEELALLEVLSDPVWLGEFLRSTGDFAANEEERKNKKPFEYRWYQKDLLTDTTPNIILTGGRAIGKCNPIGSRIYTQTYGYMRVIELLQRYKKRYFVVSALGKNGEWVNRRAILRKDGYVNVYSYTTYSGHTFLVTKNHPILTPDGWVPAENLGVGDLVAVTTRLPETQTNHVFSWEEMRWFGYVMMHDHIRVQRPLDLRFQSQVSDLSRISAYFDTRLEKNRDGSYQLIRKKGPARHYGTRLLEMFDTAAWEHRGVNRLPLELKAECNESIQVFLEALFSYRGEFSDQTVKLRWKTPTFTRDIQELLLRFGIETIFTVISEKEYELTLRDYNAYYNFFTTFNIPGVGVRNLKPPAPSEVPSGNYRFEEIVEITERPAQNTYAIQVWEDENYICDNVIVHNSVVLEDKHIYNAVNSDTEFPETKESLLATANTNQMTPLLDHITNRFMTSPILRGFLNGQINKTKGTLDFTTGGSSVYRLYARIAGQKGENNVVGLHVPRIAVDEVQLFPTPAWIQLLPTLNSWEKKTQIFVCGVPNGIREGNVLYMLDQKTSRYKKYRIPATENPYWLLDEHIESIKRYGGEDSDDFKRLVLGQHGEAAYSVIPRDKMRTEPYEFYSYRYSQTEKSRGKSYTEVLGLPNLPYKDADAVVLAMDTGYTDPTVIQLFLRNKGVWRCMARWRLTRISFPEQAEVINWIDDRYSPNLISIDIGAGGGGIGISQDLLSNRFPKSKKYEARIAGANFSTMLDRDDHGKSIFEQHSARVSAKSAAGEELSRMIIDGDLVFSEIDAEALSQLERVAYTKRADGSNQYFVLSERGMGRSADDHIFAAYLVFIMTLNQLQTKKQTRRLSSPRWV
jgi:hypothetical protein